MSAPELDPRPVRPLTSREIVKVLGGLLGGLIQYCEVEPVRDAVRWLAETDAFWVLLQASVPGIEAAVSDAFESHFSEKDPS